MSVIEKTKTTNIYSLGIWEIEKIVVGEGTTIIVKAIDYEMNLRIEELQDLQKLIEKILVTKT